MGQRHERIRDKAEVRLHKCDFIAEIYDAGLRYDHSKGISGYYPVLGPLLPSGESASAQHLTYDRPLKIDAGTFFDVAGVVHRYHYP